MSRFPYHFTFPLLYPSPERTFISPSIWINGFSFPLQKSIHKISHQFNSLIQLQVTLSMKRTLRERSSIKRSIFENNNQIIRWNGTVDKLSFDKYGPFWMILSLIDVIQLAWAMWSTLQIHKSSIDITLSKDRKIARLDYRIWISFNILWRFDIKFRETFRWGSVSDKILFQFSTERAFPLILWS